ncbi:hypothetical protein JW926_00555 [Candidatus Sumerlaeota bacterium]|nr:hypothetical protein [Candidatus Sumerlaeota bacterium]
MLFYAEFTLGNFKNWKADHATAFHLKQNPGEKRGVLEIRYEQFFDLESIYHKDVSGYEGLLLEVDSTSRGSVNLSITDCRGNLWHLSNPMETDHFRILFPFENFSNPMEKETRWGPASLETLRIHVESMEGNTTQTFIIHSLIPSGTHELIGPSIAIDPSFAYYRKPWKDIANEVRELGFTCVHVIIVNKIPIDKQKEIVGAFHDKNIACILRLFPTTDFEAYEAHPEWRQKSLDGSSRHDWRVYLCPNSAAFTEYTCGRIKEILGAVKYDAIELAEPWFEIWGGPYKENPTHGKYACLCDECRKRFREKSGIDPLDLFNESSPYYFLKKGNEERYEKWQQFRVDTVIEFSRRLYSAAKEVDPDIEIIHMHLSDATVEPEKSREYQAQDMDKAVKILQPDALIIQDAWQDWTKPDLKPEFAREYARAYVKRARDLKKNIIIKVHADIGSLKEMRRSYSWMREFSATAREGGFDGVVYYELSLGDYSR